MRTTFEVLFVNLTEDAILTTAVSTRHTRWTEVCQGFRMELTKDALIESKLKRRFKAVTSLEFPRFIFGFQVKETFVNLIVEPDCTKQGEGVFIAKLSEECMEVDALLKYNCEVNMETEKKQKFDSVLEVHDQRIKIVMNLYSHEDQVVRVNVYFYSQ